MEAHKDQKKIYTLIWGACFTLLQIRSLERQQANYISLLLAYEGLFSEKDIG